MRSAPAWIICIIALVVSPSAAAVETIAGIATVVDGDTIAIGKQRVRLWGIDAPESHQQCGRAQGPYPCGAQATVYLSSLLSAKPATWEIKTYDRYRRAVALCMVAGTDISAAMVSAGLAVAFIRYSSDYVLQEEDARSNRRGMWEGTFTPPWDWRAGHR